MSDAVSGVPAEAAEAGLRARLLAVDPDEDGMSDEDVDQHRSDVECILAAALPVLREGIAAEVLGPVRAAIASAVFEALGDECDEVLASRIANVAADRLSAPVQAAEEETRG